MTTTELCPYCENEVEISSEGKSICPICGKEILPCSMCNMNEVDCNKCNYQLK